MMVFAIGIELAQGAAVDCPQSGDARELDPATMFGRGRQHLGRREDGPAGATAQTV
jgi:hypothetical protein